MMEAIRNCFPVVAGLLIVMALAAGHEAAADPGRVPEGIHDEHAEGVDLWIYNDIAETMSAATLRDRPIFVTFRCVPCEACRGFDYEVAQGSERIRELAAERFVSVRQVEMKGVDLNLFQFDYDLNWAAMFINADGAVYGRYGTQSAEGPDAYNSIESLEKAMRRVLELHERYPQNRQELAGKRGPRRPYRTALQMPGMDRVEERRGPTTRQNCIHCHNIHDAQQRAAQDAGAFTFDMLHRYPLPENIGLRIERDDGRRIEAVIDGSAAAAAGLRAGDEVTHMNGQAIVSIADMQWVLHHLPGEGAALSVRVLRDGEAIERELRLREGWRETDFSWRGSIWSLRPRPGFWAPALEGPRRRELGLGEGLTPLEVRWINKGIAEGRAAAAAGLREGDVIVAVGDRPADMTPRQFQVHLRLHYKVGQTLPLTVLRNGERREVRITLVE